MATGYDFRQPQRDSFTFTPAAPVQANTGLSGRMSTPQMVGGNSQGGVVTAGPITQAAPTNFGKLIDDLVEPYVQREQQKKFYEGFNRAQQGIALDELDRSNKGIRSIFGPSDFEQGAQFYAGQKAVADHQQWVMDNQETLRTLDPTEAAHRMADDANARMTGHGDADLLIQKGIMEATGPLMATTAKNRFAWQQTEAVRQMGETTRAQAGSLQKLMSMDATMSSPDDAVSLVAQSSMTSFIGSMAKPEGMTIESYQGFISDFLRDSAEAGNMYAVEAMRAAGYDKLLTDDQRAKFEATFDKASHKVLGDAASSPDFVDRMTKLEVAKRAGTISREQYVEQARLLNEDLKRSTGSSANLFDYKDLVSGVGSIAEAQVAEYHRQEARGWAIEDREDAQRFQEAQAARKKAEDTAQVRALYAVGNTADGEMTGVGKSADYAILAANDYRAGNFDPLVMNFNKGKIFTGVATEMQRNLESSLGRQYDDGSKKAYADWKTLHDKMPGAADAYFGKYAGPMNAFHELVTSGMPPEIAFTKTMNDPSKYVVAPVPANRKKEVDTAVSGAVSSYNGWSLPFTRTNLNDSGRTTVSRLVERHVAMLMSGGSTMPAGKLAERAIPALEANGQLERYAQFAIENRPGTTPLHQLLRIKPEEADDVIPSVIDAKLKAAGYSTGAGGNNYDIYRVNDPNGRPALYVLANDGGRMYSAVVSYTDMSTAAEAAAAKSKAAGPFMQITPNKPRTNVDINRRIPGETGAQRLARRNREVRDGADPLPRRK